MHRRDAPTAHGLGAVGVAILVVALVAGISGGAALALLRVGDDPRAFAPVTSAAAKPVVAAGGFELADVAIFDPRLLTSPACAGCMPSPRFNAPARGAPPNSSLFAYASDATGWQESISLRKEPNRDAAMKEVADFGVGAAQQKAQRDSTNAMFRRGGTKIDVIDGGTLQETTRAFYIYETRETNRGQVTTTICSVSMCVLYRDFVLSLSVSQKTCPKPIRAISEDLQDKARALVDRRFPK